MHLNIWKELTQKRRRERQSKSCQRQVWLTVVFHPYKRFLWRLRQKVRRGEEMHLVHKCDQLIAAMELKAFKKQFSMKKFWLKWTFKKRLLMDDDGEFIGVYWCRRLKGCSTPFSKAPWVMTFEKGGMRCRWKVSKPHQPRSKASPQKVSFRAAA